MQRWLSESNNFFLFTDDVHAYYSHFPKTPAKDPPNTLLSPLHQFYYFHLFTNLVLTTFLGALPTETTGGLPDESSDDEIPEMDPRVKKSWIKRQYSAAKVHSNIHVLSSILSEHVFFIASLLRLFSSSSLLFASVRCSSSSQLIFTSEFNFNEWLLLRLAWLGWLSYLRKLFFYIECKIELG